MRNPSTNTNVLDLIWITPINSRGVLLSLYFVHKQSVNEHIITYHFYQSRDPFENPLLLLPSTLDLPSNLILIASL